MKHKKLTDKQLKCIAAVLSAPDITTGCKEAGVSRTMFYRYMQNEQFRQEYDRCRRELVNVGLDSLKAGVGEAVSVLRELLHKSRNDHVRIRACQIMIEAAQKSQEIEELSRRIDLLEERMKGG